MDWNETKRFLATCLPEEVCDEMELMYPGELREIRIRAERPAVLCTAARSSSLHWTPDRREVEVIAEALSGHSLYARTEETGQGFVTLEGGHRMGLCGQVTRTEGQAVLQSIGSICLRIAGQWPGAANALIPLAQAGSLLLIGPPASGKTTLLRDLARQLASGRNALQVSIIDERCELAACVDGAPQLEVGERTDVLYGLSKPAAVAWLVRAMSPQVIVTDELSGADDAAAILEAMASGVRVMASVHGTDLNDLAARPAMAALMAQRRFAHYVVLSGEGCGQLAAVYGRCGNPIKS